MDQNIKNKIDRPKGKPKFDHKGDDTKRIRPPKGDKRPKAV